MKLAPAGPSVAEEALSFGLFRGLCRQLPAGSRVGIDIVQISRVMDSLQAFGDRFGARLFTAAERAYAEAGGAARAERLAARFAAKEAAIKALGFSEAGIDWREIEVCRTEDGACHLMLHGKAAQLAHAAGADGLLLSLSHDGDHAAAVVVVAGRAAV